MFISGMPNTYNIITLLEDRTLCSFENWVEIGWMFTHRFYDLLVQLLG